MDINQLIKALKKGNNLEQNLSLYGNMLAGSYHRLAAYHLAMNLTEYYDEICGSGGERCEKLLQEITEVLRADFAEDEKEALDLERAVNIVDDVRTQVLSAIHDLEEYTYFMQTYEHMLNRIEYRLKGDIQEVDEAAFAAEVGRYVSTGDAVSSNERIQTVMAELPVRMTMAKFMDMVKDGCRYYAGVRNDMAEAFFEAMADGVRPLSAKRLNPVYDRLYDMAVTLEAMDLEAVDEVQCEKAMQLLAAASENIAEELMPYLYLAEIVNHLYIYLLTKNYVLGDLPDTKKAETVIREFLKSEAKGSFLTPDEDIVGLLRELTKKQEMLVGEHMLLENAFYEIVTLYPKQIDGLALNGMYNSLYCSSRMFNEGALQPLGKRGIYFAVNEAWIDAKLTELKAHYTSVFDGESRTVKRAQMAFVIGSLPVIFDSIDDFEAYVRGSLSSCADRGTRAASAALIGELMAADN